MQSGKTVTGGVVLRVTDTKETDRILTVLTADRGKIPLIARGARRKNSRLAAACQMPAYSELTIFKRGSWYMLDEASPIELFDGLGRDIELLALAAWFCELTEAVCAEETAQPEGPVLDISGGFVACGTCRGPERSFRLPLTEAGLAALRHVLYADPRRLYSFTLEPGALQALDQAGEAFIAAQLERGFRTLDYYKALLG